MRTNLDTESRALLYAGASVNQLTEIFGGTSLDMARRLGDLKPVGTGRQGNPIYNLAEACARVVKPVLTAEMITKHLRRMNPKDLPPMLNKLFWEGLAARDRYKESAGELWNASDVTTLAADAFQSLRMSLLLIPDVLRDETALSEKQFEIVQKVIDTALETTRVKLVDDLSGPGHSARPGLGAEEESLQLDL